MHEPDALAFRERCQPRPGNAGALLTSQRALRALEEGERVLQRLAQLAEQRSDANTPEVRIRAWEKLHGLRLPSDSRHAVLDLIANGTGLSVAQVHGEQRARQAQRERVDEPALEGTLPAD